MEKVCFTFLPCSLCSTLPFLFPEVTPSHPHSPVIKSLSFFLQYLHLPIPMEVSDLIARTKKFSCLDSCIELPPNQSPTKAPSFILLGKLITSKTVSLAIVSDVVNRAWRPTFQIQVKQVDKNVFTFYFRHKTNL